MPISEPIRSPDPNESPKDAAPPASDQDSPSPPKEPYTYLHSRSHASHTILRNYWKRQIDEFSGDGESSDADEHDSNGIGITFYEAYNGAMMTASESVKTNDDLLRYLNSDPRRSVSEQGDSMPSRLRFIYLPPCKSEFGIDPQGQLDASTVHILLDKLELPHAALEFLLKPHLWRVGCFGSETILNASPVNQPKKSFIWTRLQDIQNYPDGFSHGTMVAYCIICDQITMTTTVIVGFDYLPVKDSILHPLIQDNLKDFTELNLSSNPFELVLGCITCMFHRLSAFYLWREEEFLTLTSQLIEYRPDDEDINPNLDVRFPARTIAKLSYLSQRVAWYTLAFYNQLMVCRSLARLISQEWSSYYDTTPENVHLMYRLLSALRNLDTTILPFYERARSYENRIKTAIETQFHLINDKGNEQLRLSTSSMAENTDATKRLTEQGREENAHLAQIAEETRKDSFAMRTISIVTMAYLPGAFVSSIFGMQLIQVENNTLNIVRGWQYFVAITLGLTTITFAFWYIWLKYGYVNARLPPAAKNHTNGKPDDDIKSDASSQWSHPVASLDEEKKINEGDSTLSRLSSRRSRIPSVASHGRAVEADGANETRSGDLELGMSH